MCHTGAHSTKPFCFCSAALHMYTQTHTLSKASLGGIDGVGTEASQATYTAWVRDIFTFLLCGSGTWHQLADAQISVLGHVGCQPGWVKNKGRCQLRKSQDMHSPTARRESGFW